MRVVLIGGGARSGKSAFAVAYARRLGERRTLVATAEGRDDEMRARIARHARERGRDFTIMEEPLDLTGALDRVGPADVVVIDCLTLWLANLLLAGADEGTAIARVEELAARLAARPFHTVVVTNEVGMGLVPETALGRTFRDVVGRTHQRLAGIADEIYVGILGTILRLTPGPVAAVPPDR